MQNAALLHLIELFAMARHARVDAFIIGIGRVLKLHALAAQHIDRV